MKRLAFTMIELIFVIVILGILAAVAVPKLAATRDDAKITKINSDAVNFLSDVGMYYMSKGTYGTATLADVTNIQFGTTSAPTDSSTLFAGSTLNLTDGTDICIVFKPATVAVGDGNMTVSAVGTGTGTICSAVKEAAIKLNILGPSNADKNISFGGISVKDL